MLMRTREKEQQQFFDTAGKSFRRMWRLGHEKKPEDEIQTAQ